MGGTFNFKPLEPILNPPEPDPIPNPPDPELPEPAPLLDPPEPILNPPKPDPMLNPPDPDISTRKYGRNF
jgi:hypothetical protein